MACNIVINDVIGIDNNLEVEEIIVSGTAEDCLSVKVEINIGDVLFTEIVDVDDGIWTAHIEVADVKCNASYSIEVSCVDGEEDCVQSVSGSLRCRIPECPALGDEPIFVEEPCNEDGTRNLNVSFSINAPEIVMATIDFGNGNLGPDIRPLIPGINQISYRPPLNNITYVPGGHNINISFEGACNDINIPFVVSACDVINECLELIGIEVISIGECDEDGKRDVELRMTVNSPVAQRITLNFGDLHVDRAVLEDENVLIWENPADLSLSSGRIEGTIVSENCPDVPFTIDIPECKEIQCPIIWGDFTPLRITCSGRNSLVTTSVVYDNRSNEVVRATIDYGNNQNVVEVNLIPGDNHILPLEVEYESRDEPYNIVIRTEDKCEEKVIPIGIVQDCRSCPEIGEVSYEFDDCILQDGLRVREVVVTFGYDTTHPCQITIDFGPHGSFDFGLMGEQNAVFREMIHLPINEALRGQIIIACDDLECANVPLSLKTVPNCEGMACGSFEEISVNIGECQEGNVNVTVEVEVFLAMDTRVSIDYGDGEPAERQMEAGEYDIVLNHSYPEGAHPVITITQDFPEDCDPTVISLGEITCEPPIILIPDPVPEDDDSDGGEGAGCVTARWLIAIGGAVALLAGLLALCVPAAAGALAIVAAVAAGVAVLAIAAKWLADWLGYGCPDPCGMNLLIAWQVMLGAGVGAIYFSDCCWQLLVAGLGLIATSLIMARRWAQNCNAGLCRVVAEITAVLAGVVIPVITYIDGMRHVSGCVNGILANIIIVVSALLGIWVSVCVVQRVAEEL